MGPAYFKNFYGSKSAVREDMAVALVKALDLTVASDDELEEAFSDYDSISENLRTLFILPTRKE